ncbi:MAG: hypothetical protein FD143_3046 [Ignavibacteria bacterium]|nr:MAG: hypothetical protein FD143_3046 [Ignavibacteria bacterium]
MILGLGQKVIEVEGAKFFVEYPNVQQKYELENIIFQDAIDTSKIDLAKWNRYVRHYLRYTIKNWQGVTTEDGTEIICKIVNNELEDSLWQGLCKFDELTYLLFTKIQEVLRWTGNDKKKFISSEDSNLKVD